ncbi:hypothetical protein NPIL_200521, partial [Nephila pilipes]
HYAGRSLLWAFQDSLSDTLPCMRKSVFAYPQYPSHNFFFAVLHCTLRFIFHNPQSSSPDLLKPASLFTNAVHKKTPPLDVITHLVEVPIL